MWATLFVFAVSQLPEDVRESFDANNLQQQHQMTYANSTQLPTQTEASHDLYAINEQDENSFELDNEQELAPQVRGKTHLRLLENKKCDRKYYCASSVEGLSL